MKRKFIANIVLLSASFSLFSLALISQNNKSHINNNNNINAFNYDQVNHKNKIIKTPTSLDELNNTNPKDVAKLTSFDARDYGIITSVKDQGGTPWCWAYSFSSASETAILKEKGVIDSQYNNQNLQVNVNNVVYVANNRTVDADKLGLTRQDTFKKGMYEGRHQYDISSVFAQWNTPTLQGSQNDQYGQPVALLENSIVISNNKKSREENVLNIKEAIAKYGSVTFTYDSAGQRNYNEYFNSNNGNKGGFHSCQIIGWDDNIPKEKYNHNATVNGGWLVKNSWGTIANAEPDDKLNGFFYLSYDSEIYDVMAYDYANSNEYDNNYYYDGMDGNRYQNQNLQNKEIAAIFQSKKNDINKIEKISAINFALYGEDATVIAKIYKNIKANLANPMSPKNDPTNGTLVETISKTYENKGDKGGIYTLKLNSEIELEPYENFSIVLTVSNSKNDALILCSRYEKSTNDLTLFNVNGVWKNTKESIQNSVASIRAFTKTYDRPQNNINDIKFGSVLLDKEIIAYSDPNKPIPLVKFNNKVLVEGKDYQVEYEPEDITPPVQQTADEGIVGFGNIKILGINDYTGLLTANYQITKSEKPSVDEFGKYNNLNVLIDVDKNINKYSDITLPNGWRFAFKDDEINEGLNTGNYVQYDGFDANCFKRVMFEAVVTKNSNIVIPKPPSENKVNISTCRIEITNSENIFYSGKPIILDINIFNNSSKLVNNVDYQIRFENNINVGEAKALINGTGAKYEGNATKLFSIKKAKNKINNFVINSITNKPSANADFGKVYFKYYLDEKITQQINNEPLDSGIYYVTAHVDGNSNYESAQILNPLRLEINKSTPPINDIEKNDNSTSDNQTLIIVIATSVSLITLGAGSIIWFLIKKFRK